jgi:hypothetical protein
MAPAMGEPRRPPERGGLQQQGVAPPVRSRRAVNLVAIDGESAAEGKSTVEGGRVTGRHPGG